MIVTVYRGEQAYSLASEEVLRVAAAAQFVAAWDGPGASESASGQLGFALGQPVLAREPDELLGAGRLAGGARPEGSVSSLPARHLVLLQSCDGDVRHAVWADGLDWQPSTERPSLAQAMGVDAQTLG
nr:hypothetical protein NCPCFENI_00230 [Cupriavidus sp.]